MIYLQVVTAVGMLAFSIAGLIASERQRIGKDEPQIVLRLSWIALIFAALTALFAADGG